GPGGGCRRSSTSRPDSLWRTGNLRAISTSWSQAGPQGRCGAAYEGLRSMHYIAVPGICALLILGEQQGCTLAEKLAHVHAPPGRKLPQTRGQLWLKSQGNHVTKAAWSHCVA